MLGLVLQNTSNQDLSLSPGNVEGQELMLFKLEPRETRLFKVCEVNARILERLAQVHPSLRIVAKKFLKDAV